MVRGRALLTMVSYHRGGPDQNIFREIARLSGGGRVPFLLVGGFNNEDGRHVMVDWALRLKTVLVTPSSATCFSKGWASTLDYIMSSEAIRGNLLHLAADYSVPFSPHAAIRFGLKMDLTCCQAFVGKIRGNYPSRRRRTR